MGESFAAFCPSLATLHCSDHPIQLYTGFYGFDPVLVSRQKPTVPFVEMEQNQKPTVGYTNGSVFGMESNGEVWLMVEILKYDTTGCNIDFPSVQSLSF